MVVSGKWIYSCGLSFLKLFLVEADFENSKVCKSSGKSSFWHRLFIGVDKSLTVQILGWGNLCVLQKV